MASQRSKFASTLIDILDDVSYRRVRAHEQDDPIYRLRYEAYRREEFIPFNSLGVCTDDLDDVPNILSFGVYIGEKLVSSLRLHHVTAAHRASPGTKVFSDLLDPMLDNGMTFIDPSRFTADHEASLAYPALPFLTLRLAAMASVHFDASYCLATIRPEHSAFYRRVFLAEPMGDLRPYPGLDFSVELYAAEVARIKNAVYLRYPFFMSTPEERQALFDGGEAGFGTFVKATARAGSQGPEVPQPV